MKDCHCAPVPRSAGSYKEGLRAREWCANNGDILEMGPDVIFNRNHTKYVILAHRLLAGIIEILRFACPSVPSCI